MKEDLELSAKFTEFWTWFPRRVAKQAAFRAFKKALKLTTADKIIEGAKRYAAERWGQDIQYTAHPATWINRGSYDDYQPQPEPTLMTQRGFYAAFCSAELDAWEQYGRAKNGKGFPRDRNGGWWFPTQWPPK